MRHKRVFIFIGILILSALCVYAVVHTVTATAPVPQKEGSDAVRATVKTKDCSCCDRVKRVRERVQERLRKERAAAESAETAEESPEVP